MPYYNDNDYYDYLAHHGILGQRWGKKNGPPYPLGYGDHSASEKRAGWRSSLNKDKKVSKEDWRKSRADFDGYDIYKSSLKKKQDKAYNKLAEAEKKDGARGVYKYITSNRDLDYIRFQDKNKNAKIIENESIDIKNESDAFNAKINKMTSEALGAKSYADYMKKNGGGSNITALTAYYVKGLDIRDEYLKTEEGKTYIKNQQDRTSRVNEAAKAYEREAREFVRNKLGDYASKECSSDMAIKYNKTTNKITKQTMEDMVSIEMLRRVLSR